MLMQVTTEMSDLAGEQLLAEEQAAQARADAKKAKKLRKKQKRKQAQQLSQHVEVSFRCCRACSMNACVCLSLCLFCLAAHLSRCMAGLNQLHSHWPVCLLV